MKIFVDFDDVLFHTKAFRGDLIMLFEKHGVVKDQFNESYYAFPHRDPKKQFGYLQKKYNLDTKALEKDFDLFITQDLGRYVFADVAPFLESFDKKDLYLLTIGAKVFQKLKVDGSGLQKYFNRVIVTQHKKTTTITQLADEEKFSGTEALFLIDDHPSQLTETYRGEHAIHCIHMRRPEGRYSTHACLGCTAEAMNLSQAREIIEQFNESVK